jgi:hypothetical protein
MINLFWNLYQQGQISRLQSDSRSSGSETEFIARREASQQVQELHERLDRTVMAMHAMWTLMAERTNLTQEDLVKRVTEIDAQDGVVDGRITPRQVKCACGATVSPKFGRCLFCGKECPREGMLGAL